MKKILIFLAVLFLPIYSCIAVTDFKITYEDDYLYVHGKTFGINDENFRLGIFPNAIEHPVRIEMREIGPSYDMIQNIPQNKKLISNVYLYDILRLDPPYTTENFGFKQAAITLAYNELEIKGKSIYFWDNIHKKWIMLPSNKSRGKNWMTAWVHLPFSRVAVMGDIEYETENSGIDFSYINELSSEISSDSYILINETDKQLVAGKNIYDKFPIASLTKLMTASVLIDNKINFEEVLTYNATKHYAYRNYMGLKTNEKVEVNDLFNAMLIGSLNVPSRMLVDATKFTEKEFISQMNEMGKALGMDDSYFQDTSGLSPRNVSTVNDLYKLFSSISRNDTIMNTLGTRYYEFEEAYSKDSRAEHRFRHTNYLMQPYILNDDEEYIKNLKKNNFNYYLTEGEDYDIVASKTGYTDEALVCLVMNFIKNGKEYTLISLGNPDYENRFDEPIKIVEAVNNRNLVLQSNK